MLKELFFWEGVGRKLIYKSCANKIFLLFISRLGQRYGLRNTTLTSYFYKNI